MNSNSQYLTFVIIGCALLYTGSQSLSLDGGDVVGWMSVAGGMTMAFIGLYFSGDERPNTEQYQSRRRTPTHIKDIEVGGSFQHRVSESEQERIEQLLSQEKVIEALGLYRRATGHSLREAKDYIDKTLKEMDQPTRSQ